MKLMFYKTHSRPAHSFYSREHWGPRRLSDLLKLLIEPELEPRSPVSQGPFAQWKHNGPRCAWDGQLMNYVNLLFVIQMGVILLQCLNQRESLYHSHNLELSTSRSS